MADEMLSAKALALIFRGLVFTNHIAPQLNTIDIRSFGQVLNLMTTKLIHRRTLQTIEDRLTKIFTIKGLESIKDIMRTTGSCIAGSFVTSSILEEDWNGDIDFFCPATEADFTHESYKFEINHIGNKIYDDAPITQLEMYLRDYFNSRVIDYEHYAGCSDAIKVVRTYEHDNSLSLVAVQAVLVNTSKDDLHDWIFRNFDFSICKAIYYVDPEGRSKVNILKLHDILDKRCDFHHTNRLLTSIARYHKYTSRGFSIYRDVKNLKQIVMSHPEVKMMYPPIIEYLTKYKISIEGSLDLSIECNCVDCPATFCGLLHCHYRGPFDGRVYLSLEACPKIS